MLAGAELAAKPRLLNHPDLIRCESYFGFHAFRQMENPASLGKGVARLSGSNGRGRTARKQVAGPYLTEETGWRVRKEYSATDLKHQKTLLARFRSLFASRQRRSHSAKQTTRQRPL